MKTAFIISAVLCFCCLLQSCGPYTGPTDPNGVSLEAIDAGSPRISKVYDSALTENHYPFMIYLDGTHMVSAEIEGRELFDKYNTLFESHSYSGNGYCWEGHITQILEKEDPELLQHLTFDPEAGGFYVFADNESNQRRFAYLLSRIFSDIPRLETYIKSADRSRIDD